MSLGKIRDSLTSEINPNLVNNNETKLASVLIVIFAESPKILMIRVSKELLYFFTISSPASLDIPYKDDGPNNEFSINFFLD